MCGIGAASARQLFEPLTRALHISIRSTSYRNRSGACMWPDMSQNDRHEPLLSSSNTHEYIFGWILLKLYLPANELNAGWRATLTAMLPLPPPPTTTTTATTATTTTMSITTIQHAFVDRFPICKNDNDAAHTHTVIVCNSNLSVHNECDSGYHRSQS